MMDKDWDCGQLLCKGQGRFLAYLRRPSDTDSLHPLFNAYKGFQIPVDDRGAEESMTLVSVIPVVQRTFPRFLSPEVWVPRSISREKKWSCVRGGSVCYLKLEPGQPKLHSTVRQAPCSRIAIAAAPGSSQDPREHISWGKGAGGESLTSTLATHDSWDIGAQSEGKRLCVLYWLAHHGSASSFGFFCVFS
ncbi:hypothetical protein Y1Q_0021679 [Alligator mississippiensis]|uniref:Uncharacterized protein n=1 Tax=Alligator mississippiensis TaxID=8496 RepID=A0A151PAQ2_ALLMI|nr:hypothetical protein Y1Q_0021679 [Alligator mississippiensis]